MVVAAYPLAKVGLLLMKQLSKPLANIIKNEAKRHPKVRKYVVAPTGKAFNWIENQTLGHMKGIKPSEVTEEEIVELGSNAIGEIVLFALLTIILLAEYNRQGDKKAVLEKVKAEEIVNLQDLVLELVKEVEIIKKRVATLEEDMTLTSDVIELEERRHTEMHDDDFLDLWNANKKIRKDSKKLDKFSPTI